MAALAVAAVLVATGALLIAACRSRMTGGKVMRTFTAATTALIAVLALALPGGAQTPVVVQVDQSSGTRQFFVEDLAGNPLSTLALPTSGAPQAFRVRVVDDDYILDPQHGFTVDARLNNLYLKTGTSTYNYGAMIPSGDVRLGFLTHATQELINGMAVEPSVLLDGTISCTTLNTLLAGTVDVNVLNLLSQLCNPVTGLLSGGSQAINDLPISGTIATVTTTITNLLDLPVSLLGQDPGDFTNPDYVNGIGVNDPAKPEGPDVATVRGLLTGTPLASLPQALIDDILAQLNAMLAGLPAFAPGGVDAVAATEAAIQALMDSSDQVMATYGQLLSAVGATGATDLLNNLLGLVVSLGGFSDLVSIFGTYLAFPTLRLLEAAPVAGLYEGTLTVTFTQL